MLHRRHGPQYVPQRREATLIHDFESETAIFQLVFQYEVAIRENDGMYRGMSNS